MFKNIRNLISAIKTKRDIKGMIKYQYRVDEALARRPALAGINVDSIHFKFRKDVLLLPYGRIVCVGNGSLLPKLEGHQYHYCNSTDDVASGSILLTSGSVIIEEETATKNLTCYYAV